MNKKEKRIVEAAINTVKKASMLNEVGLDLDVQKATNELVSAVEDYVN